MIRKTAKSGTPCNKNVTAMQATKGGHQKGVGFFGLVFGEPR